MSMARHAADFRESVDLMHTSADSHCSSRRESTHPPPSPTSAVRAVPSKPHAYPIWAPRFWHGMGFPTWFKLLARNRFAISPSRIPMAASITNATVLNSFAGVFAQLMFGHRVRRPSWRSRRCSCSAIGGAAPRCCTSC